MNGKKKKNLPAVQDLSLGGEDPLKEEMATHSSVLAWEVHGQRSLAGCSPWGCKSVGHDLATNQQQ